MKTFWVVLGDQFPVSRVRNSSYDNAAIEAIKFVKKYPEGNLYIMRAVAVVVGEVGVRIETLPEQKGDLPF